MADSVTILTTTTLTSLDTGGSYIHGIAVHRTGGSGAMVAATVVLVATKVDGTSTETVLDIEMDANSTGQQLTYRPGIGPYTKVQATTLDANMSVNIAHGRNP